MYPLLSSVLSRAGGAAVRELIGGLPTLEYIRGRVDEQAARAAAKVLARHMAKAVGASMHPDSGASLEARLKAGEDMGNALALQAAQAAEAVLGLRGAQAERERTREQLDSVVAFAAREAAEARLEQAMLDLARVASGDPPRE